MSIKVGDICAARLALSGAWPSWYLGIIKETATDEQGTSIEKFRIIGEDFDREHADELYSIRPEDKQTGAKKLAASQWGRLKSWDKASDLKQAIINAAW
jgi:hypothetical protein